MRSQRSFVLMGGWLLALSIVSAGCNSDATSENDASSDAASGTAATGDTVTVTEDELRDAMEKDDLARFLGQQLELKGVVQGIGGDGGGHLLLETLRLNTVDAQPWAKVLPGQEATLLGTYTEERGLKFDIASVAGERYVMTAAELTNEFIADKPAANAKYNEQWLDVSGVVSEAKLGDADIMQIDVQGDGDKVVRCTFFPEGQQSQLATVKAGDTIHFVGAYMTQTSFDTPLLNFCLLMNE